jgi:hypothetical protein
VPLARQPLGQRAIPALAAADRIGKEAVIYKADSHAVPARRASDASRRDPDHRAIFLNES